ncbi:MAG TPA: hypothetical protein VH206_24195 [Xanthobacteraceae bacterium]|jgi:hypothetical protein|nr:hypothetical protein [Xanthobacteraceae bacterium]
MKSLKTKLALSALAVTVLASPAFAQRAHHPVQQTYSTVQQPAEHYPDGGAGRTGTAESFESGNEFNLGQ